MDEKQAIEQEIRNIRATLSDVSSPFGDWKHIKYSEYISQGKSAPYSDVEMNDYYAERETMRERINELQEELESLAEAEEETEEETVGITEEQYESIVGESEE